MIKTAIQLSGLPTFEQLGCLSAFIIVNYYCIWNPISFT